MIANGLLTRGRCIMTAIFEKVMTRGPVDIPGHDQKPFSFATEPRHQWLMWLTRVEQRKLLGEPDVELACFGQTRVGQPAAISGHVSVQRPVGIQGAAVTAGYLAESLVQFSHGLFGPGDPDRKGAMESPVLHSGGNGA